MCNGCEQLSVFLGHWAGWHPTAARPTAPGPAATTRGGVTPPAPPPPPRPGRNGWHCTPPVALGRHHSGVDHERKLNHDFILK